MFQGEKILQRTTPSSVTVNVFDPYVYSRTIEWIALKVESIHLT